MKKIILLILCFQFQLSAYNQVIKGTVLDKKTKSSISFASVYFNATYVGANTDSEGKFELDISKYKSMPLTISAIGYYSATLDNYSTNEPLQILLIPKDYALKEVGISAKSLAWQRKKNLVLFKEEFLGTGGNAQNCEILNEKDISFNYGSDKDTLKAFATKPILIVNKILGYNITYFLDQFEYYKKNYATFFKGNIIFQETKANSETQLQHYNRNRQFNYLGSKMQFFRALWSDNLKASGFIVKTTGGENLQSKDIVFQSDNHKFLKYPETIYLKYSINGSYIIFLKELVYFDKTGYFDPSGINWKGEMAEQRIADWLPYEYVSEK